MTAVRMLGFVDLKPDVTEAAFRTAFDDFSQGLVDRALATGWELTRRRPHHGYDSTPPPQTWLLTVIFKDADQAEACWDYIEARDVGFAPQHDNLIRQVTNATFALYDDLAVGEPAK